MPEFKVVLAVPVQMGVEAADHEKAVAAAIDQLEGMAEVVPGYDVHCLECARVGPTRKKKAAPSPDKKEPTDLVG